MVTIRYVEEKDRTFWYQLDKHLPEQEFSHKVQTKTGYVLLLNDRPIGLLRYNLFWDNTPFCNLLFVDWDHQGQGYGKRLMLHWEADMKARGYQLLLTSTQVDEAAQHFYRRIGYRDCGGLLIDTAQMAQPMELFLLKEI